VAKTLKAEINQQLPNPPWQTSLLSAPSSKNLAWLFISPIEYHSIWLGFIFPIGPFPYNDILFNFPPSVFNEPNSLSTKDSPSESELYINSHFFIAASSLFNIVSIFFPLKSLK